MEKKNENEWRQVKIYVKWQVNFSKILWRSFLIIAAMVFCCISENFSINLKKKFFSFCFLISSILIVKLFSTSFPFFFFYCHVVQVVGHDRVLSVFVFCNIEKSDFSKWLLREICKISVECCEKLFLFSWLSAL